MKIETSRLILRPLQLSDEDHLLEYQSHPEIVAYIPWPERTREQVREALEKTIALDNSKFEKDGDVINLGWELKSTGQVIGQSNLNLQSLIDKRAEIGYVTHQHFQRQGFAYEASIAMLNHAFLRCDVHRVIANIDTRSLASATLARKLGMRLEATFKDGEFFKGAWCDMWLYAILKSEFKHQFTI